MNITICILKIDTLLFPDNFQNFREMCLKISHVDPTKLLASPGLAGQAALQI